MKNVSLLIGFPIRHGYMYGHVLDWVNAKCDGVVHAVEAKHALDWAQHRSRRKTWDTVCGKRAYPWLARTPEKPTNRTTIAWPVRAAGLKALGMSRCVECNRLTGKRRPVTEVGEAIFASSKGVSA